MSRWTDHEVFELLVEMTGHQQHGIFELRSALLQARSRKLPAVMVVPIAIAAIRNSAAA